MNFRKMAVVAMTISCAAAGGRIWLSANAAPGGGERGRLALSHTLPRMDGHHLLVKVVEVNYGPGESSPAHSHPCPVIGYVAEGTLRTRVQGEPEAIYKAGESFYEAPNGVHAVSANASQTEGAKLIAYFVCDRETPLSVAPAGEKQP
jgi:quercetin dioxygenase-like cupin family protein